MLSLKYLNLLGRLQESVAKLLLSSDIMALSFHNRQEHLAALYDACALIVNTYRETEILDDVSLDFDGNVISGYKFHLYSREVIHQISNGVIK